MKKPQAHRFWKHGLNCSRGKWRLFVYKSDYDNLLKAFNELQRMKTLTRN